MAIISPWFRPFFMEPHRLDTKWTLSEDEKFLLVAPWRRRAAGARADGGVGEGDGGGRFNKKTYKRDSRNGELAYLYLLRSQGVPPLVSAVSEDDGHASGRLAGELTHRLSKCPKCRFCRGRFWGRRVHMPFLPGIQDRDEWGRSCRTIGSPIFFSSAK